MPMPQKHLVERYHNYEIYIITPNLFNAEKKDPSKGVTVCGDTLEECKQNIDKVLERAKFFKVNIYDGPAIDMVVQNPHLRVQSVYGGIEDRVSIVVKGNYDFDVLFETYEMKPGRKSKKYKKSHKPVNVFRIICRNRTVSQK